MSSDLTYYATRANEERRVAMASSNPNVRRVHLEMAEKYAALADSDAIPNSEVTLQSTLRAG